MNTYLLLFFGRYFLCISIKQKFKKSLPRRTYLKKLPVLKLDIRNL